MNVSILQLTREQEITLPCGVIAEFSLCEEIRGSARELQLCVALSKGKNVRLPDVLDTSAFALEPTVTVITGLPGAGMFLFGGESAYRVGCDGSEVQKEETHRESRDGEYWDLNPVPCEHGVLLVYEAGVLLVNEQLQVVWHRKKFYNDRFDGLDGDVLNFLRDEADHWSISARDGRPSDTG